MIRRIPILVAILALVPAVALAGGSYRAHDGGFLLRMSLGIGDGGTEYSDEIDDAEFSGAQGDFSIAVGGVVTENLALHGTLFLFSMPDPRLTLNGNSGDVDGTVTMAALGGGVTWWLMPANLYVSGSLGIGTISFDDNRGGTFETDSGLALELTLGKEWFVSDYWGIGLAGGFTWHSIPDGVAPEDWSGTSVALRFSATFN